MGLLQENVMVSNPHILQPNMVQPWGVYRSAQQFTESQVGVRFSYQESMVSAPYMSQLTMVQPCGVYRLTQQFTQFQVGVGSSSQESMVSAPYMSQPTMLQPWGVHRSAQYFTIKHSLVSQLHSFLCLDEPITVTFIHIILSFVS